MASLVKRGKTYYVQYYLAKKLKRRSLNTDSLQVAKEKLRQIESARCREEEGFLSIGIIANTPNKACVGYVCRG